MNDQNLVKPFGHDQSREEASKNGRKGGIASGKARREKKKLIEELNQCLAAPLSSEKLKASVKKMGMKTTDATNQTALVAAFVAHALHDARYAKILVDLVQEEERKKDQSEKAALDRLCDQLEEKQDDQ